MRMRRSQRPAARRLSERTLARGRAPNDEWLVGRGYLSAESTSLVLAGPDDHPDNKINGEVPELQAACAANVFTDDVSAELLHHVLGLDSNRASTWSSSPQHAR
jgi:hypothetical protein